MTDKNNKINDKDLEAVNGGGKVEIIAEKQRDRSYDDGSPTDPGSLNSPTHAANNIQRNNPNR